MGQKLIVDDNDNDTCVRTAFYKTGSGRTLLQGVRGKTPMR